MKNTRARSSLLAAAAAFVVGTMAVEAEAGKKVTIKLGTLAPESSPWFNAVKRMGQRWKEASGGAVDLKIYPGGVAGDEGDMIRKVRVGQLHAATITGVGLGRITRASMALQVPMMIQSYEELDYVRDRLSPKIAEEIEKGGFVVLNWGDAGWVHFFSRQPASTPDEFRKQKMFLWSGDPESEKAWKAALFKPVPMSATDVLSGLQTGLIDWFGTTPLYALTSQWFGLAPHMYALNWAPLNGATVVSKAEWEKIDPALRPKLLEIAREEGEKLKGEVRRLGDDAKKAMRDRGLKVTEPTPEQIVEWQKTAEMAYPVVRAEVVPAAFFDEVQRLTREYRAQKK